MAKNKVTQSELDGVQYRRAKLWQIILVACNALNGMAVYILIGQASYAASIGFGISTLIVGTLLTFTRIFDAITDPLLAFLYDRMNTRWGKIRPLLFLGWLIQSIGIMAMYSWTSSKGFWHRHVPGHLHAVRHRLYNRQHDRADYRPAAHQ